MKTLINNHQKIPTVLGLIILVFVLFIGITLSQNPITFLSKASQSCSPVNIQITNLTYQSFDLSFLTSKNCLVTASVNNQIYNDVRGQKPSKTHYFVITNLKPDTPYQYKFIADGNEYIHQTFTVSTFSKTEAPQSDASLSWGRVFLEKNLPATDSIVYLNIPSFYPLSSYVTSQGYWNIPLINSYLIEDKLWAPPPPETVDEIIVLAPDGQVVVLENNSMKKNPVPDIFLNSGQFDQATGSIEYVPFEESTQKFSQDVTISNPSDGDTIDSLIPQFFGHGPAGVMVDIELNSPNKITDSFVVSKEGSWQWTPPATLEPGAHSVKLKYTDPVSGIVKTITRRFTVLAQSDIGKPAFTASESAIKTSSSPSPKPTTIPTIMPTTTSIPIPTIIPTKAPPTATPTLVVSGGTLPTLTLFVVAIFLVLSSIIFLSY